jgi:hypothetical protein
MVYKIEGWGMRIQYSTIMINPAAPEGTPRGGSMLKEE